MLLYSNKLSNCYLVGIALTTSHCVFVYKLPLKHAGHHIKIWCGQTWTFVRQLNFSWEKVDLYIFSEFTYILCKPGWWILWVCHQGLVSWHWKMASVCLFLCVVCHAFQHVQGRQPLLVLTFWHPLHKCNPLSHGLGQQRQTCHCLGSPSCALLFQLTSLIP